MRPPPLVLALVILAGIPLGGVSAAPPPAGARPTSLEGASPPVQPGSITVAHVAEAAPDPERWTDETPDRMIDDAVLRATAPHASEGDAIAAIVTIDTLADRASYPHATNALAQIASARSDADVHAEAALTARALAGDEGTETGRKADEALGVLTHLALLGPFRDTGGGLLAKEGPEAPGGSFADMDAHYAWGTIDVAWRAVPPAFATASGVPFDVFVHPRKESCTLVATRVDLPAARAVVVRLASSGSARLMFDGKELGRSDDVLTSAKLDRLAARVQAAAGPHLVVAKVCSGALDDDGRVRLRLTDDKGAPLVLPAAAKLANPPPADRLGVQNVATPLARVLSPPAAGNGELDAAIVRLLGGADDLKSPRGPGMLDVVTRQKDASADRFAMAGWVAPSGANRSGWLNQARTRAIASGDARTRTFAERRLLAEHLNAHLADWAMARRLAANVDAGDSEGTLLGAMIDEGLGTDALRARALASLERAARTSWQTAPSALLEDLGALASGMRPALWLEARVELARRGHGGLDLVSPMTTRSAKELGEAASRAFAEGAIADADEGVAVARLVSRAGAHEIARGLFASLIEWAPNVPEAWAGLADEIAATSPDPGATPDSRVALALRRARELAPGEARYRAELALRQPPGGRGGAAPQADDERYLVTSQAILARRQGVPSKGAPDVADRELHWLRAVVLHPDHRVSQLIHYAREIVIAPRTQDELLEDIPAEGDLTEILRARVHRKNGGTAFPTEEHNEGARPRIRWPELEPGDVVEVAIRTWTAGAVGGRGDPPFYFLDYAGATTTHPLVYNEVVVDTEAGRPLYLEVLHGAPDRREDGDENGRHITRLIWDRPPLIADEPLTPALSEVVPMTVGSTFKNWADFRAWYSEAVRDFSVPDDEVRRLAGELTKGKATKDAKLRALFDFVADDIRYVNYVSGEWWLPNRPQQLLARREGDCDDKAILLITLLRAIGISAEEVMVQTRETGQPSILLGKGAAIPMFDHGIAFLPGPGGGMYLDATSPQSRLGPLPSMDASAVALRIDAGPAEIVHLPASSPEDHGSDVTWTITLHPDGSGDLAGEEKHTGDGAFWLRTYLTEEGRSRAEYVEQNLVGGWFPTVLVDPKVEFKGDLAHGQAWVHYRAHSDGLARHEQGDLVVPLAQSATLASQLAPLVQRTLPVSLPPQVAPSHQARTVRIVAPPGFRWGGLPPGGDENGNAFGRAHLDIRKDRADPRAVIIKRSVVFDEYLIPVDQYGAWRAWLQRVDALMHKGVRLVPEGTGK